MGILNMVSPKIRTKKLPSQEDCTGKKIYAGDLVRIVGYPDFSGMSHRTRRESEPVFRYLRGKYKKIRSFSQNGLAEIEFRIRKGKLSGLHTVWLESYLLRRKA
jgi:hypothetical protein